MHAIQLIHTPSQQPQQKQAENKSGHKNAGLTEILLSQFDDSNLDIILPMLAHLSQKTGNTQWFTWIAPQGINKKVLALYGFNSEKIRLVHTKSNQETVSILSDALSNGKSDVVVATCNTITKQLFNELNSKAIEAGTRGLILSCA